MTNKSLKIERRIFLNTTVLYGKMIITTLITLFSTRIVLDALGVEDFGLYNLIAGVITLLSFMNSALMAATQRFLSVEMGTGNAQQIRQVFATSLLIHIALGVLLLLIVLLIEPLLFDYMLEIPESRVDVGRTAYVVMTFTMLITVVGVPFNAAINSHEDMWMFAIIETIMTVLKLVAAYVLYLYPYDRLILYCYMLLLITLLGVVLKMLWCARYAEVNIRLRSCFNRRVFGEMCGFVTWSSMGALSQIGRNQGVAVVLNMFFGIVVNAAYGITNQVNSLLTYFSHIMTSTLSPQIMKSKGENNPGRMIYISVLASKLSFFLSAVMAVIFFMDLDLILGIWLKKVPEQSLEFCQITIWTFLIMQLYPGLVRLILANGSIRAYQITTSLILITNLPLGYFLFYIGYPAESILISMLVIQVLCMVVTLWFSWKLVGLNVRCYLVDVVVKPVAGFICVLFVCSFVYKTYLPSNIWSLGSMGILSTALLAAAFFRITLNAKEREKILSLINIRKK